MIDKIVPNGAVVLKVWPDGSGETIAFFQYETAADEFCQLSRDKDGPMLIRISLYDGRFRGFPSE